jgi:hypothetical protein
VTGSTRRSAAINGQLLAPLSEATCEATDPVFGGLLGGGSLCEDGEPFLQLPNPLDLDVPVVDLSLDHRHLRGDPRRRDRDRDGERDLHRAQRPRYRLRRWRRDRPVDLHLDGDHRRRDGDPVRDRP